MITVGGLRWLRPGSLLLSAGFAAAYAGVFNDLPLRCVFVCEREYVCVCVSSIMLLVLLSSICPYIFFDFRI